MKIVKRITTCVEGIERAVKIVGSEAILAAMIGVRRQKLNYWKLNASLPYEMAIAICIATDGKVGIDELRPDKKDFTMKLVMFFKK